MASIKQLKEGLEILSKYFDENDNFLVEGRHDEILVGGENTADLVSVEDYQKLKELGWGIDSENECWRKFT